MNWGARLNLEEAINIKWSWSYPPKDIRSQFGISPYPWRIHVIMLYMVCHGSHQYTTFMLLVAYIPAPWILWDMLWNTRPLYAPSMCKSMYIPHMCRDGRQGAFFFLNGGQVKHHPNVWLLSHLNPIVDGYILYPYSIPVKSLVALLQTSISPWISH